VVIQAGRQVAFDWASHTTGQHGEFLAQITHTPEALAYLQRILGYSITGHISNQVMLIMIGEGGAGKSLLLALLKRVMGPFYKDVSKNMLVTSKGQRPLGKGAANPDEAGEQATQDSFYFYQQQLTWILSKLPLHFTWVISSSSKVFDSCS
jgi:hypothetical protein